jgi:hypothetical protein
VHLREKIGQHMNRIACRAAIEAGMQIPIGASDGDLGEGKTAEEGGDGGRLYIPHAGVADEGEVGRELFHMCVEERRKGRAAGFFLALEQHAHVDRQHAVRREDAQCAGCRECYSPICTLTA